MLLKDTFPELFAEILRDLRSLQRTDLLEQLDGLQIVDRCRCGEAVCGTFKTHGMAMLDDTLPHEYDDIMLDCGATITVVGETIVSVETLDPLVTEVLRQAMP